MSGGPLRDAILVLTQDPDPTADVIVDRLRELDLPVIRFDSSYFPHRAQMTARWRDGRMHTVLHIEDDGDVDLATLRSIWYRRPREFTFSPELTPDSWAFARAEARQGFAGALQTSPALWVNRPHAESVAGLKMLQLRVAAARGLTIPETLVTNRPAAAEAFLDEHDSATGTIYKRLSSMLLFTADGALTAFQTEKVDAAARSKLDHVAVTPCLFQRYVPKAYEIRATVVGETVIAASVDSQSSAHGQTDWRVDAGLTWEPYQLPESVEQALRAIVADLGLIFGAVDLIRDPDGGYVFLEVNPSGQWAWFHDEITHPIRDAIIGQLADPPDAARGMGLAAPTSLVQQVAGS
ncbi:MAG TPA: hypothetical protein VNT55_09595 [Baekduia sp.]|nr:hypothetical protein [Baekduia sp.]